MTGARFEDLCRELLEANGYGRVEKCGGPGDGGIDLLARGRRGLIAVECKYRRGGTVGREVVQKLHSAAQAEHATSAIVMATGGFSADARRYARRDVRGMEVRLMSIEDMSVLAERAGMRLVMDPGGTAGLTARFHPLSAAEARDALAEHLSGLQSHPLAAAEIASAASHSVELRPYYLATASLQKEFQGGTRTVHRIDVVDERVLINGESGRPAGPEAAKFYGTARIFEAGELDPGAEGGGGGFAVGADAAGNAAADHMARRHARTVRYKGRNNVRYSKRCAAGRGDVDVGDVRPVVAERHVFGLRILGRQYKAWVEYNGEKTRTGGSGMDVCSVCSKRIRGGGRLLCNDCGAIVHAPGRWPGRGHGHACGACGRTVCDRCAHSERRWGVLKKPLCRGCALGGRRP